jgi:hypothetical protein
MMAIVMAARFVVTESGTEAQSGDLEDSIQRVDPRLTLGVGIEAHRVLLEGRYALGFRSVVAADAADNPLVPKSRSIELLAGVRF